MEHLESLTVFLWTGFGRFCLTDFGGMIHAAANLGVCNRMNRLQAKKIPVFRRKQGFIRQFRCLLVEISGIEPLTS